MGGAWQWVSITDTLRLVVRGVIPGVRGVNLGGFDLFTFLPGFFGSRRLVDSGAGTWPGLGPGALHCTALHCKISPNCPSPTAI